MTNANKLNAIQVSTFRAHYARTLLGYDWARGFSPIPWWNPTWDRSGDSYPNKWGR